MAKSYVPSKPGKYGIRLYVLCAWKYVYCYNFYENGKGNISKNTLANNYLVKFPNMRFAFKCFVSRSSKDDDSPIDAESAPALWMLQISQMTQQSENGKNHLFTDSYYTRHLLA